MLRHQPLKAHLTGGPKQIGADLALFEGRREDAVGPPCQQPRKVGLSHGQRKPSQIITVQGKNVEGVELHLAVMLSRVQGIEIGDAVDAEHHGLTINDKMPVPILESRFDDPGVTVSPVVTVARQ